MCLSHSTKMYCRGCSVPCAKNKSEQILEEDRNVDLKVSCVGFLRPLKFYLIFRGECNFLVYLSATFNLHNRIAEERLPGSVYSSRSEIVIRVFFSYKVAVAESGRKEASTVGSPVQISRCNAHQQGAEMIWILICSQ